MSRDDEAGGVRRRAAPAVTTLVVLGASFAAARASPSGIGHSTLWFALACLVLIVALLARGLACRAALCAAVFLGGFGWFTLRVHERPRDSLALLIDADEFAQPSPVRVCGMVTGAVEEVGGASGRWPLPPSPRQTALALRVRTVGEAPASGILRVRIDSPVARVPDWLRAGAWVELTGTLRPVPPALNPAEPPRELLAAQDDLVGTLHVPSAELMRRLEPSTAAERLRSLVTGAVASVHETVERSLGGPPDGRAEGSRGRALLRAMLLGERDPALRDVESAFRRVGLVHVIAISGFNLAVLAWVVLLVVRLTGDRGWIEPAIGAGAVAAYMVILPGEASIQRAGWTVLVFTVSEALGRRYDRMALLAWTACVLLLVRPMDLWSLGFQLSFGIVAALVWLGDRVHERLWGMTIRGLVPTPRQRTWWWVSGAAVARGLKAQVSATLLAWAVAAPMIALHTGQFSPLAPVASLVVLPVTAVLMVLGYVALLLGLVVPPLAADASGMLAILGDAAVWIVTRIDEWPGASVHVPRLSAAWAAVATACVVYWLGWGWIRDWRAWGLTAASLAWLAALVVSQRRLPPDAALRVDALAVGDGSCVLVRAGGDAMLVDGGASASRPDAEDAWRALRELGAWRVPVVMITDPGVQSWSLLPDLIEPLGVRTVLIGEAMESAAGVDPAGSAARLLALLHDRGVAVRVLAEGDRFALGSGIVTLVGNGTTGRALLPRVGIQAAGGAARSVVLGSSATYGVLAGLSGRERHAAVLVTPRVVRGADRPAEIARSLGAELLIHSGGAGAARDLVSRMGPRDVPVRFTARGAAWAAIDASGGVASGQWRER